MIENKLKKLFDYQRFEQNESLQAIISETESYYNRELSDDDLFFVNAAGELPDPAGDKSKPGTQNSQI